MPYSTTHILIPLTLVALFRDFLISKQKKKSFHIYYVLIAGLAGALPDIDVALYWILHFFGFAFSSIHRTFSHSLLVPILFFVLFTIFARTNIKILKKQQLKLSTIFLMISFGTLTHLVLDYLVWGTIMPLYPIFTQQFGLNLVELLPYPLREIAVPSFEAALLIGWIVYLELRHKISDFI